MSIQPSSCFLYSIKYSFLSLLQPQVRTGQVIVQGFRHFGFLQWRRGLHIGHVTGSSERRPSTDYMSERVTEWSCERFPLNMRRCGGEDCSDFFGGAGGDRGGRGVEVNRPVQASTLS